jgi:hypothetical protein
MKKIYDRHSYKKEKKQALAALATEIDLILNPPADNVVPMRG